MRRVGAGIEYSEYARTDSMSIEVPEGMSDEQVKALMQQHRQRLRELIYGDLDHCGKYAEVYVTADGHEDDEATFRLMDDGSLEFVDDELQKMEQRQRAVISRLLND